MPALPRRKFRETIQSERVRRRLGTLERTEPRCCPNAKNDVSFPRHRIAIALSRSPSTIRNPKSAPETGRAPAMAVSYKSTSAIAANVSDNKCRWDGASAPHYEVWFLTLNHRASQRGFWFRYVLESPVARAESRTQARVLGRSVRSRTRGLDTEDWRRSFLALQRLRES